MSFIIGTAGHIDHGKSALVKAITGIDPDRLKEEKERGITIDIGFASYKTKKGDLISFIDVPGHEKFIKNMIAGAVGIDAVLLVIAANESIKPQTIEHLKICELLGINKGIIAVTKIDLVEQEKLAKVKEEIQEFVKESFLKNSPIIFVNSITGEGIEKLKQEIEKLKNCIISKPREKLLRIPIDRVFIIKGFGVVCTGTIFEGIIYKNQSLEILPKGLKTKAKNIQVHKEDRQEAYAGERVAINLIYIEKEQLSRGDIVCSPKKFLPSNLIEAKIIIFKEYLEELKKQKKLRFFHGTSEHQCSIKEISFINKQEILCQIELSSPTVILCEDKFILRTLSPMQTIGGGYVLDLSERKIRKKDLPYVKEKLEKFLTFNIWEKMVYWVKQAAEKGLKIDQIIQKSGYPKEIILHNLQKYEEIYMINKLTDFLISREGFTSLKNKIIIHIADFQKNNPFEIGIQRSRLKSQFFPEIDNEIFHAALKELIIENKIISEKEYLKLSSFSYELKQDEKEIIENIKQIYNDNCYCPISWQDAKDKISNKTKADKLLHFLINQGELIRIDQDVIYNRVALENIKNKLVEFLKKNGEISVGEFKNLIGVSRKYAIPLLEYFDKKGITLRVKDRRRLKSD